MSSSKSNKKETKNIKALFSIICLCIISLGLIVYYSAGAGSKNDTVNENTTLVQTTEVQRAVTVEDTKKATSSAETTTAKAKTKPSKPSTTEKTTMELGKTNTPYKSYYKYPVSEVVQKGYSEELSHSKTMGDYRSHAAVDFTGEDNEKVVAINDGIVTDVYEDAMFGMTVEIDHGGKLVARYSGLKSVSVKKGAYVDIGNKIGTIGNVPCEAEEGAHLHFSCKLNGKTVNPLDVMSKTE